MSATTEMASEPGVGSRKLFENDKLKLVARARKTDSVVLNSGEDFLGVISADDARGSSYTLQIAILDFDLEDDGE